VALAARTGDALFAELVPDTFFQVDASPQRLPTLRARLQGLPFVEAAYIKPPASLPFWATLGSIEIAASPPSTTPNFLGSQIYLEPAPDGVGAKAAWLVPGGKGQGISIIDLEWGWLFQHEDLSGKGGCVIGINDPDTNHGTAVIGVLGGDDNPFGVTGIVPEASLSTASFGDDWKTATARTIDAASRLLAAGDIMVVEIHRPGPRTGFAENDNQQGYIATEWFPDDLAAVQRAVARGVIVVAAAGNGGEDLDSPLYEQRPADFIHSWRNPFNPNNPGSGAILVGAGAPPPGTHNNDWGPDRSRLDFSNFGRRVDAQGWGLEVTTCGYGYLQGGLDNTHWYTDRFGGTSSATPIVAGALASVQGILRSRGKRLLTPAEAVAALRETGSEQQDAPDRPATQRIGHRPDIQAILGWAKAHGR
jgi:subtilisin family serine protease